MATLDVSAYVRMSLEEQRRFDGFVAEALGTTTEEFRDMCVTQVDALMDDGIVLRIHHHAKDEDGRLYVEPGTDEIAMAPPLLVRAS